MPDAKFLETYPLYKRFAVTLYDDLTKVPKPAIQMACERCAASRTFNMRNDYISESPHIRSSSVPSASFPDPKAAGKVLRAIYRCASCYWERVFLLEFGPEGKRMEGIGNKQFEVPSGRITWIRKVGESPRWAHTLDKPLREALGHHAALYERGLACEAESFGIGAYAYYRRAVEDLLEDFVATKTARLAGDEKRIFEEAVAAVRRDWSASRLIDLVKDELPAEVRPGGANPIALLHGALSEGLHGRTEEECLDLAKDLRELLGGLFLQLQAAEGSKRFEALVKRIHEKGGRKVVAPEAGGSPKAD